MNGVGGTIAERTLVVGPLSGAVEARAFEHWVQGAKAGDSLLYAWGPVAPRGTAAFALAREWSEGGFLELTQKRSERGWDYIAKRRMLGHAKPPQRARDVPADDDAPIERMYRSLVRRANLGMHCPTNQEFNADLGVTNAAYLFGQLCKAQRISSVDAGAGWRRIVTIAKTGFKTKRAAL